MRILWDSAHLAVSSRLVLTRPPCRHLMLEDALHFSRNEAKHPLYLMPETALRAEHKAGNAVVQSPSCVQLSVTPWSAARQASVHHLLEFAQIHVHWVVDAIQPSHRLPPTSPPAFNLCQYQDLFQWVGSSHQVAKVLELQLQHQSFQWIFGTDFLEDWLIWSPCSPRDSQESSPTPQFKSINSAPLSLLYDSTLTSIHDYWKNHSLDYTDICQQSEVFAF